VSSSRQIVPPRPGLEGAWDRLIGPGASPTEQAGALVAASAGAIVGGFVPRTARERLLGAVIGLDAFGGAWVNETPSAKQWYRRAGAHPLEPAAFAAGHVHPVIVEAVSGRRAWGRAVLAWVLPIVGCAAVAAAPPARRRTVAAVAAGFAAVTTAAAAPAGWRWLGPVLALKLVLGHATAGGPLDRLRR
jgi:hypothetical protein